MQYIIYLLLIPFFYLNYKIIISDIKERKIPNKYLLYLLIIIPFYYILLFWFKLDIAGISFSFDLLLFVVHIFVSFIVAFLLYYFWVWSAWDAKYVLVLSLFIPWLWIIPLLWNIAVLTVIYLLLYFFYFYLIKSTFNAKYRKSIFWNIYTDLKEKFLVYIKHSDWNIYKKTTFIKLLKWFIAFLILFVSLRLLRLYIFSSLLSKKNPWSTEVESTWRIGFIIKYLEEYNVYMIVLWIVIFIAFLYFIRRILAFIRTRIINKFKERMLKKFNIGSDTIDFLFLLLLAGGLMSFIIIEYLNNPYEISQHLKVIFTYYIIIYLVFRILIYSYKITFQIAEQDFIKIWDLKEWSIVDKKYLVDMFGTQQILSNEKTKEWLLYPSASGYLESIDNPIDKETTSKLKEIYKLVNDYHTKNSKWISKNEAIKILKTFAFWFYIFIGFLITFYIWSEIFKYIIWLLAKLIWADDVK